MVNCGMIIYLFYFKGVFGNKMRLINNEISNWFVFVGSIFFIGVYYVKVKYSYYN